MDSILKHSGGNWEVIWLDRHSFGVKIPFDGEYSIDRRIADAYLKAAAPELYEACDLALAAMTATGLDLSGEIWELRKALAKAKPSIQSIELARTTADINRIPNGPEDS